MSGSTRTKKSDAGQASETKAQPDNKTHYEVLGLKQTCTADEIKASFRKLALKHHPDRNPTNKDEAEAEFKRVNEAHTILSDEDSREWYDFSLRTPRKVQDDPVKAHSFFSRQSAVSERYREQQQEEERKKQEQEEYKAFKAQLRERMTSWPQPAIERFKIINTSIAITIRNLMELVKNGKATLDDFKGDFNLLLLDFLGNGYTGIIWQKNFPNVNELLREFLQIEAAYVKEEKSERKQRYQLRFFLLKKYINYGKENEFEENYAMPTGNSAVDQLKKDVLEQIVFSDDPLYIILILKFQFKNQFIDSYLNGICNHLIRPLRLKIDTLKTQNDPLSLSKADYLEEFLSTGLTFCITNTLCNVCSYIDLPLKPSEFHNYFVLRCREMIEGSIVDKHKHPGFDILRGILGAFIAAATVGLALFSSRFCQFFFYTKSRAVLDQGLDQLSLAPKRYGR